MQYILDLFTPETWRVFRESGAKVTGFRSRQKNLASERVNQGDIFLCYLTRLSRWCGALRVESDMYEDAGPLLAELDPYTEFPIRFRVKPIALLEPDMAIPIREDSVWNSLSITNQYNKDYPYWTGFFRSSLNVFAEADGSYLLNLIERQQDSPNIYQLTDKDKHALTGTRVVRTPDREVEIDVPDDTFADGSAAEHIPATTRQESVQIQAKVAQIGAEMGFRIWVPRNDKGQVQKYIPSGMHSAFLEELPLNYNDTTIRTIEQIDVLWLKGRSMARAFEVEHTTSIYSGLLRMADLLALQPNMDIHLHIVAPVERREQVLREIRRPVFSLLERGPLYEQCSYLSYDSINDLGDTPNLQHINDSIIGEYEETAEV